MAQRARFLVPENDCSLLQLLLLALAASRFPWTGRTVENDLGARYAGESSRFETVSDRITGTITILHQLVGLSAHESGSTYVDLPINLVSPVHSRDDTSPTATRALTIQNSVSCMR